MLMLVAKLQLSLVLELVFFDCLDETFFFFYVKYLQMSAVVSKCIQRELLVRDCSLLL